MAAGEEGKGKEPFTLMGYRFEQADYIFIGLLLVLLFLNFGLLETMQQLPSPIYGGDFYNGLGGVNHLMSGGSLFASAQMIGETPWVPWLYHVSVAIFATITGLGAMKGLIFFSLPAMVLSAVVAYLFITRMCGDKYLAIAGMVFLLQAFPIFKYSEFAALLMVPAFLLVLYEFVKKPDARNAAVTGVLLGLAGLSNTQAFFVSFMLFGLAFVFFFLPRLWKGGKVAMDGGDAELLKMYAIVFVAGFAISLLFWYWPIFVYHGNTLNPIQDITTPDVNNPTYLWQTVTDYSLKPVFLPYTGGIEMIFTLLVLAGIAYAAITRQSDESRFILMILAGVLLGTFHTFITLPLFGKHLVNFMLVDQMRPILLAALVPMGVLLVFRKASKEKARTIITAAVLVLTLWLFLQALEAKWENQWYKSGQQALMPPIAELESWVKANTNVNDVFLTTNEDGFMMNAVTGRKVLSYRRAHSSPYTDVNTRMADQAVIVYGSDSAKAQALLKEYHVKYLLWTGNWILNEFSFDSQGQMNGFFDPLDIPDNSSNRAYWDSAGVRYFNQTMPLDPAPRPGSPEYKVLVAMPYAASIETPYNPSLLGNFVLKKTIQYNGQDAFRIYEIKGSP